MDENNQTIDADAKIKALEEQVNNLNKGIATYRREAKEAKMEAKSAQEASAASAAALEEVKSKLTQAPTEEDVAGLNETDQKRLMKWAREQGFMTKAEYDSMMVTKQYESIQTIENQAVTDFIEEHPEYEDDDEWVKVKEEFKLYKQPTSLAQYKKILNKIHDELHPDDGKARAQAEVRSRLTLGGGSQKGRNDGSSEMDKLHEKYPNLSAEQIKQRLAEIESIFKK